MSSNFRTEPPWSTEELDRIPPGYTIIAELPSVTWGWDCDLYYWILRNPEGQLVIASTNHGSFYIGKASDLHYQINELADYIKATSEAIAMLASPTPQ